MPKPHIDLGAAPKVVHPDPSSQTDRVRIIKPTILPIPPLPTVMSKATIPDMNPSIKLTALDLSRLIHFEFPGAHLLNEGFRQFHSFYANLESRIEDIKARYQHSFQQLEPTYRASRVEEWRQACAAEIKPLVDQRCLLDHFFRH